MSISCLRSSPCLAMTIMGLLLVAVGSMFSNSSHMGVWMEQRRRWGRGGRGGEGREGGRGGEGGEG